MRLHRLQELREANAIDIRIELVMQNWKIALNTHILSAFLHAPIRVNCMNEQKAENQNNKGRVYQGDSFSEYEK